MAEFDSLSPSEPSEEDHHRAAHINILCKAPYYIDCDAPIHRVSEQEWHVPVRIVVRSTDFGRQYPFVAAVG